MSEAIATLFIVFGVIALFFYGWISGLHECPDSPDGLHEDITVRTEAGVSRQCMCCGRLTSGIDAFRRKAE